METISNLASTATSTVSNLIYGNQDTATKTNETAGKEPVSGQTGKGTIDEPYDQGNSEDALDKNTTSTTGTGIESSRVTEPTGSIQKPEDLIKAYNNEAGDATTSTTGTSSTATGSTATGITDKAGVTEQVWKPTDVDTVKPSVTDPAAAPETGVGAHDSTETSSTGKDTLWRGVDAYKDSSSTGPTSTGITTTEPTSTSTGSTLTGTEPTRVTSSESTTGGPKGAIDAEPKNYSIGDLTSGKETPPKPVGDSATSATTTSHTEPKSSESAISPPDLSNTSPGDKPDYSADTHKPSPNSGGLVGEHAGHGGPSSGIPSSSDERKSSSISPSGDDDDKSGKMDKLKDKLKTKLHIGH